MIIESNMDKELKGILKEFDEGVSGVPIFWIEDDDKNIRLYIEYGYSNGIGEFYLNDIDNFVVIPRYIVKRLIKKYD